MKKTRMYLIVAFALAIGSAFTTNKGHSKFQTTGWAKNSMNVCVSGTLDNGDNCTTGSTQCTIGGIAASDSQTDCDNGVGLLKKN